MKKVSISKIKKHTIYDRKFIVPIKIDVKIERKMKYVSTAALFEIYHQKFLQVWLEIFFLTFQDSLEAFLWNFENFQEFSKLPWN